MARDATFTDTLDALLQFLCDAAETAFVLSWVGLWGYWSWLAGWGTVGIPVALVIFALALARTIQHATHGEQFHPAVWVMIISLDVLAGFAISSTNTSLRAEDAKRREAQRVQTVAAESAVRRLADAAQHDDVAGMTVAVRQIGEAQTKEASETVAQILQKNYGSASPDRRGLALETIEALTRMRDASACPLLREISSKDSDLAETAQRAARNMCPSAVSPRKSVVSRESASSQALKLGRSVIAALPNALSPSDLSIASSPAESAPPALSPAAQCADAAGQFWHRNGFDKPGAKASNANVAWSYENHYNNELGRCLIAVRLRSTLPNGSIAASTEISDVERGGQPMATLTTRASETTTDPQVIALIKDGERLPPTPENLAWFHALMTK